MIAQRIPTTGCWLTALAFACVTIPVSAQDLRVYTVIQDGVENEIVGRNLTLFHAGKVYDYTLPSRELTVYDSVHKEFVVLNSGRRLSTSISQEQIRYFLQFYEEQANKLLDEIQTQPDPDQLRAAEVLEFQLHPVFRSHFDPAEDKLLLTMHSKILQYKVKCDKGGGEEAILRYLDYADAIAQLNSVLHPQAPLPAARLRVNEQLRQLKRLPVKVELVVNSDRAPVRLHAEHAWTWKLTPADRGMIHEWEKQLKDEGLRQLPFAQFQKETLSNPGVARLGSE